MLNVFHPTICLLYRWLTTSHEVDRRIQSFKAERNVSSDFSLCSLKHRASSNGGNFPPARASLPTFFIVYKNNQQKDIVKSDVVPV